MNGLKHSCQRSGSRVSTRHSYSRNMAGVPECSPVNEKVAARLLLTSGGCSVMIVCGGFGSVPSKAWTAGVGSTLPLRSIARTSKSQRPSSMSGTDHGGRHGPHWSSGGTGSQGTIGSGASVSSRSTRRHSYMRSSTAVLLSRAGEPERGRLERVLDRPR